MGYSITVLSVLYLSASAVCFLLTPSLSVKSPVDLELEINSNLFNKAKSNGSDRTGSNQCFCLTSDPKSEIITNYLGPRDHKLERLVVYFYRIGGKIQAFIPNKQKQKEIPDLNFDMNEGDVLKPLLLETAAEIFENDANVVSQHLEATKFRPDVASEDVESNAKVGTQQTATNVQDTENKIIEPVVQEPTGTKVIDEIIDNFNLINEQDKPNVDLFEPTVEEPSINNEQLENIVNQDINPMLSYVTEKPDQLLLSQKQNPHLDISQGNYNPKFNDWFNNQLSYVLLYNYGKEFNVYELRKRIQDILERKGIFLSNAGFLVNSEGNLFKTSNITLRSILIGDPVEYHTFNPQTGFYNIASTEISFRQVILIISIDPPELLGVVPMREVFLPGTPNIQNSGFWSAHYDGKTHFLKLLPQLGCKNCKSKYHHNTQQSDINMNELPYFELPLRRSYDNKNDIKTLMQSSSKAAEISDISPQPERRTNSDSNNNDLSGMLQSLLGIFGSSNLFGDQTRRLLSGKIFGLHKPRPQSYPNEDLPDYRIIGGKPATSSGVPLVSKGRSGYYSRF